MGIALHLPKQRGHIIMKFFILAALAALAAADPLVERYHAKEFSTFMNKFGKSYATSEESKLRFDIFKANVQKMHAHNSRKYVSWKMGINQFSDLTDEEFEAVHLGGYKQTPMPTFRPATLKSKDEINIKDLPESVNWCDKGACTPVKDQGSCGSCWAFATTAVIESHMQIATGSLPTLSTQQVTSCTPNPLKCGGTGGCYGSIPQLGFTYLQLFGHVTESDYPYTAGGGNQGQCEYDFENMRPVVGITGYNTLTPNDQDAVMTHLAEVGPLAVAVYASGWGSYRGGVYTGCKYDHNIEINHAVQLVGYGTDSKDGDFWIVRNSWGSGWGEGGYIRLARDAKAQCGTDSKPMDGTACQGGPGNDEQHVCGQCGILFDCSFPLGAHDF